ncbi:MAG: hypothetical protein J6P49_03600 [Paludibacteraceae bacterium]|nr:hypothetical protein [Paludibacteraceae bacterium]
MKKMLFAAAAMIAAMTANAVTYLNTDWAAAATANNCTWNNPNFDYTGGSGEASVSDGTLTFIYAGQASDAAGFLKTAAATTEAPDAGYLRPNKSTGNTVKVVAASGSVVSITFRNQKSSAESVTVVTGTGSTLNLDAKGGANAEGTISVTAGSEGYVVVAISNSSVDVKSYNVGAATAANDAEANVVKAFSVKANGQVVNAKVYNEPVVEVEVLDNGKINSKTVINKK